VRECSTACRIFRASSATRARPVAVTGVRARLVADTDSLGRDAQLLVLAHQRLQLAQTTNHLTLEIAKLIKY
jgi:hypothetical protein